MLLLPTSIPICNGVDHSLDFFLLLTRRTILKRDLFLTYSISGSSWTSIDLADSRRSSEDSILSQYHHLSATLKDHQLMMMSPIKEVSSGIQASGSTGGEEQSKPDDHKSFNEPTVPTMLSRHYLHHPPGTFQPIISPSRASAIKTSGLNMKERRASLSLVIGCHQRQQTHLLSPHKYTGSSGKPQLSKKVSPRSGKRSPMSSRHSSGATSLWRKKRQATAIGLIGVTSPMACEHG